MAEKMTPEGLVVGLIDEPKQTKVKRKSTEEKPSAKTEQPTESKEQTEK